VSIVITALIAINCVVLALVFAVVMRLVASSRETSAAQRFYNAWEDHLRGGFAATQEAADDLAKRYGMPKAPPLAEDEKEPEVT